MRSQSITSCSKFGIQICFSTCVECVLQKTNGFCFATSHPPVTLLDTLLTSLPVFQVLANALRVNRIIAALDLSSNPIGDAGMKAGGWSVSGKLCRSPFGATTQVVCNNEGFSYACDADSRSMCTRFSIWLRTC